MPQSLNDLMDSEFQEDDPGFLSKAWERATTPLIDAPSRWAQALQEPLTRHHLATSPTGEGGLADWMKIKSAQIQGFGAGALRGVGDLVSGFTSPLDLSATLLGGAGLSAARRGAMGTAKAATALSRAVSAPVAAHGAQTMLDPNSTPMQRFQGGIEFAGGVGGMAQPTPTAPRPRPQADIPTQPIRTPDITNFSLDEGLPPATPGFEEAFDLPLNEPRAPMEINMPPEVPGLFPRENIPALKQAKDRIAQTLGEGHLRLMMDIPGVRGQHIIDYARSLDDLPTQPVDTLIGEPSTVPYSELPTAHGDIPTRPIGGGGGGFAEQVLPDTIPIGPERAAEILSRRGPDTVPLIGDETIAQGYGDLPPAVEWQPPTRQGMVDEFPTEDIGGLPPAREYAGPVEGTEVSSLDPNRYMDTSQMSGPGWETAPSGYATTGNFATHADDPRSFGQEVIANIDPNAALPSSLGPAKLPEAVEWKPNKNFASQILPETGPMPEMAGGAFGKQTAHEMGDTQPITIPKEQVTPEYLKKLRSEGYDVQKEVAGGFEFSKSGKHPGEQPILATELGQSKPTAGQAQLQRDLRGAQPRFSIGSESFIPSFANDLDKALFIIAQKTPSKRDADFLKFVMKETGLSNVEARAEGVKIKERIKQLVHGKPSGGIHIPPIFDSGTYLSNLIANRTRNASTPISTTINPPPVAGVPTQPITRPNAPATQAAGGADAPPNTPPPAGGGTPPTSGGPPDIDFPPEMQPSGPSKIGENLQEAYNLGRGVMASGDFSAVMRQGLGLIHKGAFWKSLVPMFRSALSENYYKALDQGIREREIFKPGKIDPRTGLPGKSFAEKAGLFLADLDGPRNAREEIIMSKLAEMVPGVRRSNRAYTAFLNKLRADTFEQLIKNAKVFGPNAQVDHTLARAMATVVNTATGRGSIQALEPSMKVLGNVLFSPRLLASRIQMLNPMYYYNLPQPARMEALKSLAAITSVGSIVGAAMSQVPGVDTGTDPTSSDFGKIRIGPTRIDMFAGFQQPVVAMARLLSSKVTSSTSGNVYDLKNPQRPYDPTHWDIIERFGRGKLHPVLGFAYSLLKGRKEMSGEKMQFGWSSNRPLGSLMENAVAQRFIPLILQDMYEVSKINPELLPVTVPLSLFGVGTQTYTNRRPYKERARP